MSTLSVTNIEGVGQLTLDNVTTTGNVTSNNVTVNNNFTSNNVTVNNNFTSNTVTITNNLTIGSNTVSNFGKSLIDDADAAAARTTLGLGDAATGTIGTNVQAYSSILQNTEQSFTSALKTKLDAVGTNGNGNRTVSTSDPSGGADGDIWIKV